MKIKSNKSSFNNSDVHFINCLYIKIIEKARDCIILFPDSTFSLGLLKACRGPRYIAHSSKYMQKN